MHEKNTETDSYVWSALRWVLEGRAKPVKDTQKCKELVQWQYKDMHTLYM